MEMQKEIKVAVVPYKHLFEINESSNGKILLSGIEGKFFQSLMEALKVRYELLIPPDKEWGKVIDGNWSGMIGMIVNGKADMAVNIVSMTKERMEFVDFSSPYGYDYLTFAALRPKPKSTLLSYLYPFEIKVWLAVLFVLFTFPFLFTHLLNVKYSFIHLCIQVLGSISRQPLDIKDNSLRGTILLFSWLFWVTVITLSYSAVLLSFLTIPLLEPLIKTHVELYRAVMKGKYRCYTGLETLHLELLKTSTVPSLRELAGEIQRNKWFIPAIHTGKVFQLTENTAAFGSRLGLDLARAAAMPRKIYVSEDTMNVLLVGIAWRKDFCCKERFNTMLGRMINAGLYGKYLNDELREMEISAPAAPIEVYDQKLHLKDVAGAFIFLAFGHVLAIVQLVAEIINFKMRKRRKVTVCAGYISK